MKVVFVSSEIAPFASTGGLGEVASSLPKALARQGVDVVSVMPFYRQVADGGYGAVDTSLRLAVPLGFVVRRAEVWKTEGAGPRVYFIRRDEYFDRRGLYGLPERDYDDNFERFAFFQKAVVGLIDLLRLDPDIVHLHDWTGGLVPLFLRHGLHGTGRTARERTVFTIHNLAYQGLFPAADFGLTNLPFSCFSVPVMEFYGRINCMKAGIASSDLVTTVSGRYAGDIRTPEYGCGLDGVLQSLGDRLKGIQNGVDEDVWNPAADRFLETDYDANRPAGKAANKRQLLGQLGWDGASAMRRPLVGMVARLVDQKGLNILAEAMPEMMKRDIGFVLLGSGDSAHEAMAQEWARSWPDRFHTRIGYDQVLAHRIQAASDLFLMPSRHEPCGLSQLYAMRYGTLPVVHATGGLDDTVRDLDESPADGNGIKFREYTAAAMLAAVDRALAVLSDSSRRGAVIRRIMSEDHSWARSAREYADLYARLSRPA